jgi:cysteine synthase
MARRDERYFLPRQFENLINADDHEHSTGQEILNDDEVKVRGADALAMTRRLHRDFGLLVGTSSGANVFAALAVASKLGPDPTVVTILCDRAERYFSTRLFGAGTAAAQV